jgi:hypothetical protein
MIIKKGTFWTHDLDAHVISLALTASWTTGVTFDETSYSPDSLVRQEKYNLTADPTPLDGTHKRACAENSDLKECRMGPEV